MLSKIVIGLVIFAFIAVALGSSRGAKVAPADAKKLVGQGALLVDVRTPEEFAAGHIKGAKNIPLAAVSARLADFGAKSAPIVLYCRSGNRSGQAAAILAREGFTAIHDLGAMDRW